MSGCGELHIHFGPSQKVLRAEAEARGANVMYTDLIATLVAVRDYVEDPGNWSALDGRRAHLLALLDGEGS